MEQNSVIPYSKQNIRDVAETVGITHFPSEFEWTQIIGGLLFQGGKIIVPNGAGTVFNFTLPFSKQLLGVFITPTLTATGYGVIAVDLETFTVQHNQATQDMYWWAIGI